MTGDVRLIGGTELSGLEPLDGISHRPRTAGDHPYAGSRKRLMCIRAAVAGKDKLDVLARHELRRLNTGPTAPRNVRILNGFEVQGVRINDQEVRAAAEARIEVRIQRWLASRDCDFHQSLAFLRNCLLRASHSLL
jgi:hypothetical protein